MDYRQYTYNQLDESIGGAENSVCPNRPPQQEISPVLPNAEGQRVPEVTFRTRQDGQWKDIASRDIFNGRTVIVFALPGAYTPTCSTTHLPRYSELQPTFR